MLSAQEVVLTIMLSAFIGSGVVALNNIVVRWMANQERTRLIRILEKRQGVWLAETDAHLEEVLRNAAKKAKSEELPKP